MLSGTLDIDLADRAAGRARRPRRSATGAGSSSPTSRAGCTSVGSRAPRPGPHEELASLRARRWSASMTEEAARAHRVTATGRPMVLRRRSTGTQVERVAARPRASARRWPGSAPARAPSSRWSRGARPSARSGCSTGDGAGPAQPGRGGHRDRDRPPGRPGAAPRAALRPAARPRRRAAAQHAHRPAGAGALADRRPVRAGRRGRRDRRRLVRRVPAARRRHGARDRRRRRARHPRPPRRWARSAACCAASATPAAARPPRCSPSWTARSRAWRWTRWPPRWSPAWSRTTGRPARRRQVRLRWSSAGPPAAGRARPPTARPCCSTTSPPTCCSAWRRRPSGSEHVTVLDAGATVLLYTDGLVERRDRDIDAGTAELVDGAARVRRPAAGRAVRRGARAALPARRRGRRRDARRPAAPAGRAAAGRGRSAGGAAEHRAVTRGRPRAGSGPDAQGRVRRACAGDRGGCGPGRAGRRRPAPPSRATPTAPAGRRPARSPRPRPAADRSPSRPGEHGEQPRRRSARRRRCTGPGWTMSARWASSTSRITAPPTAVQRADEHHRGAGQTRRAAPSARR